MFGILQGMFDRATKKVVKQIDPKGSLIANSSLNDSRKLLPLAVVLKVQKGWFWQQTKYRPTQFTLNHLLDGEEIKPVCEEDEFVKYKGTHKSTRSGSVELGGAAVSLNMNGQGMSQLHLSLGKLQKEYVDIPTLVNDSKGRKLDLTHSLIQQSQKRNIGFTILTERIFTTCDCSISSKELEKGSFHAMFGTGCVEMYMEDTGKLQYDSETVLQIPPNTVMAYSVIEMTIDSDGYFDLWLEPCGLEADDISQNPCPILSVVDGQQPLIQEGVPLDTLKNALADVQTSFCALANLSAETHSSILLQLRKILLDRSVLSALVERIVMLSSDDTPCFLTNELSEKQSQIETFLDLLMREPLDKNGLSTSDECQISTANQSDLSLASEFNGSSHKPEEKNGCHNAVSNQNACSTKASKQSMEFMNAMQMLISALEEMTDAGLNLLEQFCTSEGLRSLQDLVIHLTSNTDTIPVFLQSDDEFHRVEALFKSCNVLLKKEKDTLTSEMTCSEGFLPVVLCIAIHGLASLSGA
ncbi:gasdermin-E isoform X2 [Megalobrama amblycephala]|uniref:gasdermin-E isoform X2 n=1 Tax=Megalobrama amblycephala TaxID=75352 RepID=UPI0020147096|nr:gasdermin-E isoform X2 [Megalobrama amblycephala]